MVREFLKFLFLLKLSELKLEAAGYFSYPLGLRKEFLQKQNIIFGKKKFHFQIAIIVAMFTHLIVKFPKTTDQRTLDTSLYVEQCYLQPCPVWSLKALDNKGPSCFLAVQGLSTSSLTYDVLL
jgi:hypothetical protein